MKSILMSIKPKYVSMILNEVKTLEIRKRFPSDYVGWVYIYCTKDQNEELWWYDGTEDFRLYKKGIANEKDIGWHLQNGKVVARFWCDKVDAIYKPTDTIHKSTTTFNEIMEKGCLTKKELTEYRCKGGIKDIYAIHITKLEIFDKPKEIYEFKVAKPFVYTNGTKGTVYYPLTRAPQSWQFIEV